MKKIIIIEDDALLNKTLAYNLVSDGYEVFSAYTCSAARGLLKDNYNLAVLDINLPDGNGLDLCIEIKERNPETYIVFLTANDKESDMLKGYEVGGADYITKPFSVAVFCKRISVVFETMEQHHPLHDLYEDNFLKIDFSEQTATIGGNPIDFTPKEYRTLLLFFKNRKLILTKTQLLEKIWDIDGDLVDEHTLTINLIMAENAVTLHIQYRESSLFSSVAGTGGLISTLSEKQCEVLSDAIVAGSVNYDELNDKDGILLRANATGLNVGDFVRLSGTDVNGEKFNIEVPVMGFYDQNLQKEICPFASGSDFKLTDATAKRLTGIINQTGLLSISTKPGAEQQVYKAVRAITDTDDEIELYTLEDSVKVRQALFNMQTEPLFIVALILFLFGIISMANTSLTNLLERSHEFALLQCIGMTKSQQKRMIETENMFYMGIAVFSTVILGSTVSIAVCNYIEKSFHCIQFQFQFPWIAVFLFLLVLVAVNILFIRFASRTAV